MLSNPMFWFFIVTCLLIVCDIYIGVKKANQIIKIRQNIMIEDKFEEFELRIGYIEKIMFSDEITDFDSLFTRIKKSIKAYAINKKKEKDDEQKDAILQKTA